MVANDVAVDLFAAETCGTTIIRNLLRTLAIKEFDTASRILDHALEHPLIKFGFNPEHQPALIADMRDWLGGADAQFEYQYMTLALRALRQLAIEPDVHLRELAMTRAYQAGDIQFAEGTAAQLIKQAKKLPAGILVSSHDVLGRIRSDSGEFDQAAQSFAAGAKAARAGKMDYEEWDQRTRRVWCFFAQGKHLEALREIDHAERIARRMNRADALTKTLVDRGNSEMEIGRFQNAREAFLECLAVADSNDDLERQSDALGNGREPPSPSCFARDRLGPLSA